MLVVLVTMLTMHTASLILTYGTPLSSSGLPVSSGRAMPDCIVIDTFGRKEVGKWSFIEFKISSSLIQKNI